MKPLEGLPAELEHLVHAEQTAPAVVGGERGRILERLTAAHGIPAAAAAGAGAGAEAANDAGAGSAITGGAGTAGAGTAGTPAASTATVLSLATKALVVGLAAAGTFGAGFYVGSSRSTTSDPSDRAAPSIEPAPILADDDEKADPPPATLGVAAPDAVAEPVCPPSPVLACPDPSPCDCTRNAPAGPSPTASVAIAPLATATTEPPAVAEMPAASREAAILREAWAATEQGDPFAALRALEQHAAEFPEGTLVEERDALWVRVLVDAVEYNEARERARAFLEKHPESIHRAAVQRALAEIP